VVFIKFYFINEKYIWESCSICVVLVVEVLFFVWLQRSVVCMLQVVGGASAAMARHGCSKDECKV